MQHKYSYWISVVSILSGAALWLHAWNKGNSERWQPLSVPLRLQRAESYTTELQLWPNSDYVVYVAVKRPTRDDAIARCLLGVSIGEQCGPHSIPLHLSWSLNGATGEIARGGTYGTQGGYHSDYIARAAGAFTVMEKGTYKLSIHNSVDSAVLDEFAPTLLVQVHPSVRKDAAIGSVTKKLISMVLALGGLLVAVVQAWRSRKVEADRPSGR